jgi:hypothetical protein
LKTHLLAITALFFILVAYSWQKKSFASFSTNKETYHAGENVICIDQSGDAYSISWTVRGPMEFSSTNSDFIFIPQLEGNYEITQACSLKRSAKDLKNVVVTGSISQYVIYANYTYGTRIEISVDGVYKGNITSNTV